MEDQSFDETYLQSVEGIKAADAGPFFYTRLMGRMQKEMNEEKMYRPGWIAVALSCCIAVNIWMIAAVNNHNETSVASQTPEQAFAETYQLNNYSNY